MDSNRLFHFLDKKTKKHSIRTMNACNALAMELTQNTEFVKKVSIAANFHDIGKLYIPSRILFKPCELTEEEFFIMKQHAKLGYEAISSDFDEDICEMILFHHENEDGSGYYKRHGPQIPLGAKIIHLCDVYDALTSKRSYHNAMDEKDAIAYIKKFKGVMFDENIVDIFTELKNRKKEFENTG